MYMPQSHTQKFASYNAARYAYAIDLLSSAVNQSSHDAMTCCEGWTVSDVIEHAEVVLAMVNNIDTETQGSQEREKAGDLIKELRVEIETHYTKDTLSKKVISPFGEMTVDEFLGIIWVDTFTHAWDIADASGVEHGIPSAMAVEALQIMQPKSDSMRGPGRFSAPYQTNSDDPVEQFIAFSGRKSVRSK
tara:strand:+ start:11222 stop:11791 length:570 start_codon:yes stop_codon:yes gene_type:complete